MKEAMLSIDVSLDYLDVALRTESEGWQWPHQRYENNQAGYEQLKAELLVELEQAESEQLTAVAESTGPYWWPAFYQLSHDEQLAPYQTRVAVLNPRHVKQFRKALPEADKDDRLDPQLIGRYYQQAQGQHYHHFNDRYLPLRFLSRAYARIIHNLAAEKAYLRSLLFIAASEYERNPPFTNLFGVTSMHVLDDLADIQALADQPLPDLTDQLRTWSSNTLPDPQATADRLQQVAKLSYPLPAPLTATIHHVIQRSLAHIRFLSQQHKQARSHIEQQLQQLPEAQLALDQPGLGPILVAGLLSEIQDTSRFITGSKYDRKLKRYRPRVYRDGQAAVAKLAGLWWPTNNSGRFQADERHLAQERNSYLRYWIIQSAYTLQRHDPDYNAYYWRKFYEVNRHQHKRALVLTARKALRLTFALLHKGQRACLKEPSLT